MLQQIITAGSIFFMLSGYLSAMQVPSLTEIVTNRVAEFITYDPSSCITTFTTLPHDRSSAIIQRLNLTNKSKSALPILLLSYKHYQQQQSNKKQNHLSLLLFNNQQVQLDTEQSKQLIQASATIQNLIQDTQDLQNTAVQAEEIPLPLLTQDQVIALLPYISLSSALNASNSTLPMLQQAMPEIIGLSSYWIKHTAPQQIKEYLVACTIPTLCDLIITASYLDIQSNQQVTSFIELATQALGDKLLQAPHYQEQYNAISTLPHALQHMLVLYLIDNSVIRYTLCGNNTDVITNTVQTLAINANNHDLVVSRAPNGRCYYIASNFNDNNTIKVCDALTSTCIHTLKGDSNSIKSVSWSPDGRYIASCFSSDGIIYVWDATTDTCIRTLEGHTFVVNSVSWSPDGKYIASGSNDGTVKVWDITTGTCIHTLKGNTHTGSIYSVSWSPDGNMITVGSFNKTIMVWDVSTGTCLHTLKGHTRSIKSVSWSPDGKYIASGSIDNTVKVWHAATGTCIHSLTDHAGWVNSLSWSPNSKYIASGSTDSTVRVWDVATGTCIHSLSLIGHTGWINSVSWLNDGSQVISCCTKGKIKLWNIINNELSNYLQNTLSWKQALLLICIIHAYRTNQDADLIQDIRALQYYKSLDEQIKQLIEPLLSERTRTYFKGC